MDKSCFPDDFLESYHFETARKPAVMMITSFELSNVVHLMAYCSQADIVLIEITLLTFNRHRYKSTRKVDHQQLLV